MKPATTSPERITLPAVDVLDLDVTGMTCASCAARIERKLNKLDGVTASVNYATEKARVAFDAPGLSSDDVIETIESIGYGARIHTAAGAADDTLGRLRRRLVVAVALGLPVLLLSMVPALQFVDARWRRSRSIFSGRSRTTWRRSRSPCRVACRRWSPARRWPSRACSW
jgi:Cu+-exporting ATPase